MAHRRVHLTFPEERITEPVIFNVGKLFEVVTNIRRANIEEKVGWVILELEGAQAQIDEAESYLKGLGIEVASLEGDVVQG